MRPPTRPRQLALILAALVTSALALAACGSDEDVDPGAAAQAPDYEPALERAPAELAALYAKGGGVIEGGLDALERQLEELEGYPVVVNKWASWCGPCREEFPHFQALAAKRLDEVAFLGVDTEDSTAAAETFLRDHPVPYPSFSDPNSELARALKADFGFPSTVFIDPSGEIAHVRTGPYRSEQELETDIDRYAVGG